MEKITLGGDDDDIKNSCQSLIFINDDDDKFLISNMNNMKKICQPNLNSRNQKILKFSSRHNSQMITCPSSSEIWNIVIFQMSQYIIQHLSSSLSNIIHSISFHTFFSMIPIKHFNKQFLRCQFIKRIYLFGTQTKYT